MLNVLDDPKKEIWTEIQYGCHNVHLENLVNITSWNRKLYRFESFKFSIVLRMIYSHWSYFYLRYKIY